MALDTEPPIFIVVDKNTFFVILHDEEVDAREDVDRKTFIILKLLSAPDVDDVVVDRYFLTVNLLLAVVTPANDVLLTNARTNLQVDALETIPSVEANISLILKLLVVAETIAHVVVKYLAT